jgi:hypothetical protein
LRALKQFHSIVAGRVTVEISLSVEPFAANIASEERLVTVQLHMVIKI